MHAPMDLKTAANRVSVSSMIRKMQTSVAKSERNDQIKTSSHGVGRYSSLNELG